MKKVMPKYFDTHAHYDDMRFRDDRDTLIASLKEHDVELVLNPGSNMKSSRAAVKLAEAHSFIYAAVGIHPHDSALLSENDISELEQMSKHPKVVAIGEIGLDYHHDFSPRDAQKIAFERQLELASRLRLPVVIHERNAHADALDILRNYELKSVVYHCYSGSLEHAKILLGMGCYLSFTGTITFKGAQKSHDVIRYMPSDRLMLETDAPYLAPEPHRGKRNDSTYLPIIAQLMADIRHVSVDEIVEKTFENGKNFFNIAT